MKWENIIISITVILIIAVVVGDRLYLNKMEDRFKELEQRRVLTTNKLTTAKIVYENLNHVHDLVVKNIEFPQQMDSIPLETRIFEFITTCVNDLKLKLVEIKPQVPVMENRVTTYSYDMEIEGDFFKFGELCAKFENSRRIVDLEKFTVHLLEPRKTFVPKPSDKDLRITMRISAFKVKGNVYTPPPQPMKKKG